MRAITESALRSAAERAVAGGHAITVVLFGSRARGTATADSDWDVCLVTTDDGPESAPERDAALEAEDPLWADGKVQHLWTSRSRFDAGVPANSLEEAIAREGRVLAGDGTMAKRARVKPFDGQRATSDLTRASEHLAQGIGAARRHARARDATTRERRTVSISLEAIGAVEALTRVLCALTGTTHTGSHDVAKNGRQIIQRADEAAAPLEPALMKQIGARLVAMNRESAALRGAEYGETGESYADATQRLALALETDLWVRQGLVAGDGPWAGLGAHARQSELLEAVETDTVEAAATYALEWARNPLELPSDALNVATREWVEGYRSIRSAQLRRTQPKKPGESTYDFADD